MESAAIPSAALIIENKTVVLPHGITAFPGAVYPNAQQRKVASMHLNNKAFYTRIPIMRYG